MNNQDSNSILHVDSSIDGRERSGSFSSILQARSDTTTHVQKQTQDLIETTSAMNSLNATVEKFLKTLKEAGVNEKEISNLKDFRKALKDFNESFSMNSQIIKRGSTNIETLTKSVENSSNAYDELSMWLDVIKSQYDEQKKSLKGLTAEQKRQIDLNNADLKIRKDIRAQESKRAIKDAKESEKSVTKAVSKAAGEAQKLLTNLKTAINLGQLLKAAGMSDSAKIQLGTMQSMGLSRGEFNTFKKDLYGQINTEIYTSEQVKQAIGSLKEIGINSTDEAVSKFNTIIRGQQLLGMTADQQARLQALGNKTGRDELTFTTNKMAKWMSMSTNIGQKQLAELVDLNTSFKAQFADLGISSDEFNNATDSATAALMALTGDSSWATKYTDILTNLASNTENLHLLMGMDSGTFKERLSRGENLGSLLENSTGTMNHLYRQFMSDPNATERDLAYLAPALGIDSATASFIRLAAQQSRENGPFSNYLSSFDVNGADSTALENLEKAQEEATSAADKILNKMSNWIDANTDWVTMSKLDTSLTAIIGLLTAIATIGSFSGLGNLTKGLGGKAGAAGAAGKAGFFAKAGSGGAGIAGSGIGTTLLGGGLIAAGTIWGGVDAYNNVQQSDQLYGEGHKFGAAVSGFFGGSGVKRDSKGKIDSTSTKWSSAGSGALKGAAIGAGIGTFLGPGIGTAIGAGIGALVGGAAGLISGFWKDKKAREQEERQKKQLEKEKEIAENTAATRDLLTKTGNEVTLASRKSASIRSYTGEGSTYHPSAKAISGATGVGASYPWGINSGFGARTLPNGDQNGHNGVDWAVSEGTPIGAPINGKVIFAQTDGRNTYYNTYGMTYAQRLAAGGGVNMQGNDGRIYQFWHLSKVGVKPGDVLKAGDTIGLSGNTGYSTGAHLHYGVKENGLWVDPISHNLVGAGLFAANGDMMISDSNSDAISSPSSAQTQKVFTNKIRRFNPAGSGMGAVVEGLAQIKQTLIDLSNRQSQDEQILTMLQGSKKQDPRVA